MNRKYSDNFIDKELEKVYNLGNELEMIPILPENLKTNKEIREVITHRSKHSYTKGFWYGYSLALGINLKTEKHD